MGQRFQANQYVEWNFGNGTAKGQIKEAYKERVSIDIDGTTVVRNATEEDPAYLIEHEDGGQVLKSESELSDA